MAHRNSGLDDLAETEILSKFSEQVSDSQTKLNKQFVKVQAELRKLDNVPVGEIDKRVGFQNVIDELEKAMKSCGNHTKFLETSRNQLMEISLKLYKEQGVQKREDRGRKRDSGVYSADSRVMSSSSGLVAQASNDMEEGFTNVGQGEHDETKAETNETEA